MNITKYLVNKWTALTVLMILLIFGAVSLNNLFETNHAGYYQIKQACYTGTMTTRSLPGTYPQMFGTITTYKISDMIWFSNNDEEGGKGIESTPVEVRFSDGSKALISGALKIKLSLNKAYQLKVHEDFVGYKPLLSAVRKHMEEALQNAATVMRAEDVYSARRSEFSVLAKEMTERGIFQTYTEKNSFTDLDGRKVIEKDTRIRMDENNQPVVAKESPLKIYDISVIQFTVKDIQFDKTIEALIGKKKEAEQAKVVAQADTEKAKQNAIKEVEEGKARVAKAEYDALEKKKTAVIDAEMKTEIAHQAKLKVFEESEAKRKAGEAEAYAAKLKVNAGLTPQEKAQYAKDTAIGVAQAIAGAKGPQIVMMGGSSGNGSSAVDGLIQTMGANTAIDLVKKLQTVSK